MSNYTMMIQLYIWTMAIKPLLAEPFLSEPCCILKWWQYWRSWHCWQIHSLQRLSLPCFNIYDNSQDNPTDLSPCSLYVCLTVSYPSPWHVAIQDLLCQSVVIISPSLLLSLIILLINNKWPFSSPQTAQCSSLALLTNSSCSSTNFSPSQHQSCSQSFARNMDYQIIIEYDIYDGKF